MDSSEDVKVQKYEVVRLGSVFDIDTGIDTYIGVQGKKETQKR